MKSDIKYDLRWNMRANHALFLQSPNQELPDRQITSDPPKKNWFALLLRLGNRLPPVRNRHTSDRLQKSESGFFSGHSQQALSHSDALALWAVLVSDQWLCSAARVQTLHRWRRRGFSTQLSGSQWGDISLRSCCNYVPLERYRGNRQLASSTLARLCMCQWCVC